MNTSDTTADMIAILDDFPKVVVSRLLFSGKIKDADNWAALLRRTLKLRVSTWQYEVLTGNWDPRPLGAPHLGWVLVHFRCVWAHAPWERRTGVIRVGTFSAWRRGG